jgi:Tripartite tricarboxylate transporter TctB family
VVAAERIQTGDLIMTQETSEGDARLRAESAPPAEGPTSVLIAVTLLILSGYFAIGGLALPQPEGWQTAPAMLPVLLGVSLFVMSAVLLVKAVWVGALRGSLTAELGDSSLARVATAFVFIGIFYFGLLSILPFEAAAAIFLFAMFWVFWPEGKLFVRLAIAVALPIFITLCFAVGFGLPLPGQGNLASAAQYLMVSR